MDPCGAWSLRHRAATIKLQYSRPVPQRSPEQHESHCTAHRPRMHSRRTLLGEIAWAAVSVRPHQSSPLYRLSRNSRDTLNQALPPISLHRFKGHPQLIVRRRESLGTRLPVTLSHINSLITLRMCFFSVCILITPPPPPPCSHLESWRSKESCWGEWFLAALTPPWTPDWLPLTVCRSYSEYPPAALVRDPTRQFIHEVVPTLPTIL